MAKFFDLIKLESYPYEQRDKNVLYHRPEFKVRIINLAEGEEIPQCKMEEQVVFVGIKGVAAVTIDGQQQQVDQGKCLIGGPGPVFHENRVRSKDTGNTGKAGCRRQ
ncbi:MAG: hypothetical protein U5N58_03535 [Actinomycetota bacterium]|nr:hypothetical protein [Actinomycetota bacterium]